MKMAILSNVNLDMLIQIQQKSNEVFQTQGYGQWIYYALNSDAALPDFAPKCVFVILDGFALLESFETLEEGFAEIDRAMAQLNMLANRYSDCELFVSTIDMLPKRINSFDSGCIEASWIIRWSESLDKMIYGKKHVHRFELSQCIYEIGRVNFYSDKMWYMGSAPYSLKGMAALAKMIDEYSNKIVMVQKKVLILDLDNTLWGGVLGEEGVNGITLGSSRLGATYRDAQKRIKELKNLGVLLAVVSKNNEDEVKKVFTDNVQMVLHEDDFVATYANWNNKAVNIQKLASQLNLGLDSFVFLDDNEVERETIRKTLPQVSVIDFPKDIAYLPKTIDDIYKMYFWQWNITSEDRTKTVQYKYEAMRQNDLSDSISIDEYLISMNMIIEINEVSEEQIARTIQLINKTNQFNTCTIRYDLHEFNVYRNDVNKTVCVVNVSDKYGDSGLVVVLMLSKSSNVAEIDNMLMSCRVMGRQIENAVIEAVENKLLAEGICELKASYIPTNKNRPVEKFWDNMGFTLVDTLENGTKKYIKPLDSIQDTSLIKAMWL